MNVPNRRSLSELEHGTPFADRHIGPRPADLARMLEIIGVQSLEELAQLALPAALADAEAIPDLPAPATEVQALAELRERAMRCQPRVPMIGMGYHGTVTPPVIRRSVLENPAWYTAYTPYQPEISQGGLQVMFEFQTAMSELTGLPVSNAGLYEGPSSVASAGYLAMNATKRSKFVVSRGVHPHSRETLATYSVGYGAEVVEVGLEGGVTDGAALSAAVERECEDKKTKK